MNSFGVTQPNQTRLASPTRSVDGNSLFAIHIELCKKVLDIILRFGRTSAAILTEDTWIDILKVLLGTTDSLLSEPVGSEGSPSLADELCPHILRVLMELWLRSSMRNVAMWDNFRVCV